MAVDLDTGVLAPLLVFFVTTTVITAHKVYTLRNEHKALKREVAELKKQIVASEDQRKEHLNAALDHYRDQIDRKQKDVSKLDSDWRSIEGGWRKLVIHLVEELDKIQPGWSKTHRLGEPTAPDWEEE
jgi:hypothetical protein